MTNGLSETPVAFVSSGEGSLELKNPKAVQENLRLIIPQYEYITEAKQFGGHAVVVKSANLECVSQLLCGSTLGGLPVKALIPPHLACVKGVVRGVDSFPDAAEVLDQFVSLGVVDVYRCSVVKDGKHVPTESCIHTIGGVHCPSRIKVRPLIFRVYKFQRRLQHCKNCQRYGHGHSSCKSSTRCRIPCGDHPEKNCCALEAHSCMCENFRNGDNDLCPVRTREAEIMKLMDASRFSRA